MVPASESALHALLDSLPAVRGEPAPVTPTPNAVAERTRRTPDADYESLSEEARTRLGVYNKRHRGQTLGVGRIDPVTGIWTPVLPGE